MFIVNLEHIGISTNSRGRILLLAILLIFTRCSHSSDIDYDWSENIEDIEDTEIVENYVPIPYEERGNIIYLPVSINGVGLEMIFDTGASSTLITIAEARYLYSKGTLTREDIVDYQQYATADGGISEGLVINLRKLVIGDKLELRNVQALVVENQSAPLLLGQSALKQFQKIEVDRAGQVVNFY